MQTVERPRFRQDLVAELIEDGATRFIDVADPDSGHMFRFYEVEYSLACAMDGERDVAGIVRWAEEELGLKPSPNEVRNVISTLGELGYLESGKAAAAAATEPAAASVAATTPAPTETPRPEAKPPATPPRKTPPAGIPKAPTPSAGVPKAGTNRWDQPTAMGDTDEYLERGVVTGTKRPHTPVPDVELGQAGARAAGSADELPKAADVELGAPGASAAAAASAAARSGKAADVELGAPGATSVSTDLAADMAISKADVKEAVRASQVMKSVDVPPELAAELEPAKPAAETKPADKAADKAAKPAETKPAETKPADKAAKPADKAPEKQPEKAAKPADKPVHPPAPQPSGVSPILWVLLVIVILGAGAFAVWKFVLNKKDTTAQVQPAPTPTPTPEPPPPPPVETAALAAETPAPEEIKPTAPGQIASIIATDSTVQAGDPIAKLVGFKPHGDKVAMYEKELAKYKDEVAKHEQARDSAANDTAKKLAETKILGFTKMIADREAKLAASQTELDKFLIKAPAAGTVTVSSKANARVTPNDVIATLQRDSLLVATFKSAPDATQDAKVLLAVKDSEQKLSCTVVATGGDGTKIACPGDASTEGTEVSFAGLDPAAAPAAGDDADGSADGAATDGSADGAATDGSAADADDAAAGDTDATEPAKAEKAAAPRAPARRPAPRPRPAPAPAGEPADKPASEKLFPPGSGSDKAPAPAPAPTETPAPAAGSSLQ